MSNFQLKQPSSRLGKSIVTSVATAQVNASTFTTYFGTQTRQVRLAPTLSIWATIGTTAYTAVGNSSAAYVPAGSVEYFTCTPGEVLIFISTSTSTGYVTVTEMS